MKEKLFRENIKKTLLKIKSIIEEDIITSIIISCVKNSGFYYYELYNKYPHRRVDYYSDFSFKNNLSDLYPFETSVLIIRLSQRTDREFSEFKKNFQISNSYTLKDMCRERETEFHDNFQIIIKI